MSDGVGVTGVGYKRGRSNSGVCYVFRAGSPRLSYSSKSGRKNAEVDY